MGLRSALILLAVAPAAAQQPAPLEAYGALPEVSNVAISPDGALVAYREITPDRDVVRVIDVDQMEQVGSVDVSRVRPGQLTFIDRVQLAIIASGYEDRWARSAAFLYDVRDGSMIRLLHRAENVREGQLGLGRIVGRTQSGDRLFMPAWADEPNGNSYYGLFRVETDRRVARVVARGSRNTIDWFIDADARPFLREDYENSSDRHRIWRVSGSSNELLYENEVAEREIIPVGLTADRDDLVYKAYSNETDSLALYTMNTETGDVSGPVLGREGSSIERVLLDIDRVVQGVEYEGFFPTYRFLEPELTTRMQDIQETLSGASVQLIDWSEDFDRLVVLASGGWTSGVYLLFTEGQQQPTIIARQRPRISREHVVPSRMTQYLARDGLPIPALVTANANVMGAGSAPLIVMPHGGPEAFDRAEFNWLAQYFASRGYVVLQPQFRGSTGFGESHTVAGEGEWGGKMQTDLDDGVAYLVEQDIVDPERVCIVGMNYGGYAALAAGAFSPELYRCHVSINGISDIRSVMQSDLRRFGKRHWVIGYWEDWYGADFRDRVELDALSPRRFAQAFQSPVLLIHGRDDIVIDPDQSRLMRNALRREGKDVEFVEIRGGDHWLSRPETRIEVLMRVAEFIEEHL